MKRNLFLILFLTLLLGVFTCLTAQQLQTSAQLQYKGEAVGIDYGYNPDFSFTREVIFSQNFDGTTFPPTGWVGANIGAGTITWARNTTAPYAGTGCAYHVYNGAQNPNSWLITPTITLEANTIYLVKFYEKNQYVPSYYGYSGLLLSEGGGDPGHVDFVEIYESDQNLPSYVETQILIPAVGYQRTVYFAFVYQGLDAHNWWVDEFSIASLEPQYLTMLAPVGPGTVVPAVGVHPYDSGSTATITARPGLSFFDQWERDGAFYSSDRVATLTMDADYEVQAFFSLPAGSLAQNFNYGNPVPAGWSETNITKAWQYGDTSMFFTMFDGFSMIGLDSSHSEEMLITPLLQLNGSVNKFAYWLAGGNNIYGFGGATVQVKYRNVLTTEWTNLGAAINLETDESLRYVELDISGIPNGQYYFAFAASSTFTYAGFLSWVGIDNVVGPAYAGIQQNDLEVSYVKFPNVITVEGDIAVLQAEIKNVGLNPQTGTQVTFTVADGVTGPLTTNIGTLAYNETEIVTVNYTAIGGRHTVTATLAADDNNANNSATTQGVIAFEGHLAEGFEGDVPGWMIMGTPSWMLSNFVWLPPYEGDVAAYAGSTATIGFSETYLISPLVQIGAGDELNFYASYGNQTVGPATLNIEYSVDGLTWTPIAAGTGIIPNDVMELYTIDLSVITPGDYYLGFRATGSGDGTYASWIALDHIIGPAVAEPGYIEGYVTLLGGDGLVQDVELYTRGISIYPDETGFYQFELTPGSYDLVAYLFGYQIEIFYDIPVAIGGTTIQDIDLGNINIAVEPTFYDESMALASAPQVLPLTIRNDAVDSYGDLEYDLLITPDLNMRGTVNYYNFFRMRTDRLLQQTTKFDLLSNYGRTEMDHNLSAIRTNGGESPNVATSRDQIYMYYDGPNDNAIGLTGGGTFYVAARFPASMVDIVTGFTLLEVDVFIRDIPTNAVLTIWGAGTETTPGDILHEQVFEPLYDTWHTIILDQEVILDGQDIWIGYSVTHDDATFPAGCDAGPAHPDGTWISFDGLTWDRLYELAPTLDSNWNIRGLLEFTQTWLSISQTSGIVPAGEVAVLDLTFDPTGLEIGVYNANIVIFNDAQVDPVIVPVQLTIAGDELDAPVVSIEILDGDAILTWDPILGANSYYIYASNDPYAADWGLAIGHVSFPSFVDQDVDVQDMKFYRVTASTDMVRTPAPASTRSPQGVIRSSR